MANPTVWKRKSRGEELGGGEGGRTKKGSQSIVTDRDKKEGNNSNAEEDALTCITGQLSIILCLV